MRSVAVVIVLTLMLTTVGLVSAQEGVIPQATVDQNDTDVPLGEETTDPATIEPTDEPTDETPSGVTPPEEPWETPHCIWYGGVGAPTSWVIRYNTVDYVAGLPSADGMEVPLEADGTCPDTAPPGEEMPYTPDPTEAFVPRAMCGLMADEAGPYTVVQINTPEQNLAASDQWDYLIMSENGACPEGAYQLVEGDGGVGGPGWKAERVRNDSTPTPTPSVAPGTGDGLVTICRWIAHTGTPRWEKNVVPEDAAEELLKDRTLYANVGSNGFCPIRPSQPVPGSSPVSSLPNTGSGVGTEQPTIAPLALAIAALILGAAAINARRRCA